MQTSCSRCEQRIAELADAHARIAALISDLEHMRAQLRETIKLNELQAADLERYRKVVRENVQPNRPERVPENQVQFAWERILVAISDAPLRAALEAAAESSKSERTSKPQTAKPHGRRKLDLQNLPVQEYRIVPDEVLADGGVGWVKIGDESSDRLAYRPALFFCLRTIRETWKRWPTALAGRTADATIITAEIPNAVWPKVMADPSVIAEVILSKYDYLMPLNRQERQTRNHGFAISRSTQSDWLAAAYEPARYVVDAMHAESITRSHCIATDATNAPVRAIRECLLWHVFVFIGDAGHVTFRHSRRHTSAEIMAHLEGFAGQLLADASSIYDALFRIGVVAVACWAHVRRYFWRALLTEPNLACEALTLIKELFAVARAAKALPMPERTEYRAQRARPILKAFDGWVERNRGRVDPRGKLDAALTYYTNQREALHRFLGDGRLSVDNNGSERELRNLIGGRDNWKHFENETGLAWYTTFRSLIASCEIHDLNPHEYLEPMLRLVQHWPQTRAIELAPKYWRATLSKLDRRQLQIVKPPWLTPTTTSPPSASALAQRSPHPE